MPLRPPVANLAKHQLMWTLHDEVCVTTIWTTRSATPVWATRIAAERAVIRTWVTGQWAPIVCPTARLDMIKSWAMDTTVPTKFLDNIGAITGSLVGGGLFNLPAPITAAIALRTEAVNSPVRGINGRINHVGVHRDYISGNFIGGGAAADYATRYSNLRTNLQETASADGRGTWCIVSYKDGGARGAPVYRVTPIVLPVNHILCSTHLAIQRRRRARQQSFALGS